MAQVVNVEKNKPIKPVSHQEIKEKRPPLFRKTNYILMIVGVIVLFAGYILLAGGKAANDVEFSEAIFNTRRMVVAPILMIIGLATGIVAIMYHPRAKQEEQDLKIEEEMPA